MTNDEIIALAEKHCYCSSADHKEFLHGDLIAFAEQLLENERARSFNDPNKGDGSMQTRVEPLETHLRFRSFADVWDAPGMKAYDDL